MLNMAENEIINEEKNKNFKFEIFGISIWRIFGYFIIYSVCGYIIETLFALLVYGVVESRQSFLYGPFCSIYGVGATIMVVALQYFKKNGNTLFIGGFIVGSIVEYLVSFLGEILLGIKWWDYTGKFLNVNGRICFSYSIFWGLLAIYLMKVINPKVDKIIDWLKKKINYKLLKQGTLLCIILLFIDCVISGIATDAFLTRVIIKNNLKVQNIEQVEKKYDIYYNNNQTISKIINTLWGDKKMIQTYPNLVLSLENGGKINVKTLLPEIKPYFYKFNTTE